MPPIRTTDRPKSVVFTYNHRQVALGRPATYSVAAHLARKIFPVLKHVPIGRIRFSAVVPDYPGEGEVEISPLAWQVAVRGVDSFNVGVLEQKAEGGARRSARRRSRQAVHLQLPMVRRPRDPGRDQDRRRTFTVTARLTTPSATTDYVVSGLQASDRVSDLKTKIRTVSDICVREQTLRLGERIMEDDRPLSDYPITQGSVVAIVRSLGFAKPVIYLYPPTPIKATVKISLADSWKFSALYPSTSDGRLKGGRLAEWEVLAQPDGTMRVSGTSTEIAYLFWEAESLASVVPLETPPPSRPTSPLFTKEPQIRQPLSTTRVIRCSPEDSVLLAAKEVPSYVDKALLALGLHVEGRTSFVTYWLPALLKHRHVALRFVPQVDYEAAAPLEISPPPGITTRIFMVFHGITSDRLGNWKSARERSSEPAEIWKSIVGIDEARQQDLSLFRVLEWGGMEIE